MEFLIDSWVWFDGHCSCMSWLDPSHVNPCCILPTECLNCTSFTEMNSRIDTLESKVRLIFMCVGITVSKECAEGFNAAVFCLDENARGWTSFTTNS